MASAIIQEFIQALDEEIEAIKRGKGGSIVKIFNGRFLREISGLFVYVFNLENFLAALEESPAEIEIRGSRYPAQVLLDTGLRGRNRDRAFLRPIHTRGQATNKSLVPTRTSQEEIYRMSKAVQPR